MILFMSQAGETFFTTIGCMDGRVQEPILQYGREKFGGQFADTITEAGLVGIMSRIAPPEIDTDDISTKDSPDQILLDSIKNKIDISMVKHNSKGIIVHGHAECAGNPVDDEKHKDDVKITVDLVKSLISSSIPVIGVFVKRSPQDPAKWIIEEISQAVLA